MSNETGITVIAPKTLGEAQELAKLLCASMVVPEAYRNKPADALAIIMTGAEMGFAPMQSLRAFESIKGKVGLKAEAMVAVVRSRRDVCERLTLIESTGTVCTYEAVRVGDKPFRMSFTADQARQAGLFAANPTYTKFPDAMLRARCGSAICRAMFSDLTLGLSDPDELRDLPEKQNAVEVMERALNAAPITVAPPKPSPQDAAFVPASPPNRARIVDESGQDVRPPPKTMAEAMAVVERVIAADAAAVSPWDALMVEVKARSMTWQAAASWLKTNCGATSKNATTLDMVAAFVAAHPVEAKEETLPF